MFFIVFYDCCDVSISKIILKLDQIAETFSLIGVMAITELVSLLEELQAVD